MRSRSRGDFNCGCQPICVLTPESPAALQKNHTTRRPFRCCARSVKTVSEETGLVIFRASPSTRIRKDGDALRAPLRLAEDGKKETALRLYPLLMGTVERPL
jgi:hypothetical protein